MKGRIDSGLGQIIIDTDVIATYAGSVAVECFGIIGMAAVSMKDGLVKLLRRDSLQHGIMLRSQKIIRLPALKHFPEQFITVRLLYCVPELIFGQDVSMEM